MAGEQYDRRVSTIQHGDKSKSEVQWDAFKKGVYHGGKNSLEFPIEQVKDGLDVVRFSLNPPPLSPEAQAFITEMENKATHEGKS